jgi:hypothetical protein
MRIVSLVPHATELLFALGAGGDVLGVTHECDYPPEVSELEPLTRDALPGGLSAGEIDAAVRERTLQGEAIYELDRDALADLGPDLIVTQALCPVCAVSYDEVAALAQDAALRAACGGARPQDARRDAGGRAYARGDRAERAGELSSARRADRRGAGGRRGRRAPAGAGARVAGARVRRRPLDAT